MYVSGRVRANRWLNPWGSKSPGDKKKLNMENSGLYKSSEWNVLIIIHNSLISVKSKDKTILV